MRRRPPHNPYQTSARFASTCPRCGVGIRKGERVVIFPSRSSGKKALHEACGATDFNSFLAEVSVAEYGNDLAYEY